MEYVVRIADSVHGTIGLTAVEREVIRTPAFQRLRNVKHLGLVNYVYPGCDFSRLSHSIGVCHVAGRTFEALRKSGSDISDSEVQNYRLAALLHDCGHYPFSHPMEQALKDYYAEGVMEDEGGPSGTYLNHEAVGKEVVQSDSNINRALSIWGCRAEEIYRIFTREDPPRFSNLISSDLDADRIDYLMRTARHSGLPYGSVDLPYLLENLTVDAKARVCLSAKALRTVDHFLLCRFFDYLQISFHKTVSGLELILKDVIRILLVHGLLDCSATAIKNQIVNGTWSQFDDSQIITKIRELARDPKADEVTKLKAGAILDRNPPKIVGQIEYLDGRGGKKEFRAKCRTLTRHIDMLAAEFSIPRQCWHIWEKSGMSLTSVGARIGVTDLPDPEEVEQAVHILGAGEAESQPIPSVKRSLMSVLADKGLYCARVYVLLPKDQWGTRTDIAGRIKQLEPELPWV
jgi:uncharacterized protein